MIIKCLSSNKDCFLETIYTELELIIFELEDLPLVQASYVPNIPKWLFMDEHGK